MATITLPGRLHALAAIVAVLLLAGRDCLAHPPVSTVATARIEADGRITIAITHDALAFAHGKTSEVMSTFDCLVMLNGPEEDLQRELAAGRQRFIEEFQLHADDQPVSITSVESPTLETIREWKKRNPNLTLPCQLDIVVHATLPPAARSIALQLPRSLDRSLLVLHRADGSSITMPVPRGELSPPLSLTSRFGSSFLSIAWEYMALGYEHIIPEGLDHCLFVLGLFLLSPRVKTVVLQITAFTIAHTCTLTLTSLGLIGMPASIVEPAIAASIAFIAIENLATRDVHRWRYVVAFLFGLLHGMGIATAFRNAGFPTGNLVTSLLAFTVGVEGGHLTVLLAALLTLGWWRDRKWYRPWIVIPLSCLIAFVSLYWVVERLTGAG